jgi:hypothetical protein
MLWETWKKGFDAWEQATASYLEKVLASPAVLTPAGAALTAFMKARAERDKALAQAWAAVGLPTRRDQERTLHALNQIQSRLLDLEDRLAELERQGAEAPATPRRKAAPKRAKAAGGA